MSKRIFQFSDQSKDLIRHRLLASTPCSADVILDMLEERIGWELQMRRYSQDRSLDADANIAVKKIAKQASELASSLRLAGDDPLSEKIALRIDGEIRNATDIHSLKSRQRRRRRQLIEELVAVASALMAPPKQLKRRPGGDWTALLAEIYNALAIYGVIITKEAANDILSLIFADLGGEFAGKPTVTAVNNAWKFLSNRMEATKLKITFTSNEANDVLTST
jgi:hypothetical protein